ncbi:hemerythrin domain-containing protein [Streptomyces griseoincarnatus]
MSTPDDKDLTHPLEQEIDTAGAVTAGPRTCSRSPGRRRRQASPGPLMRQRRDHARLDAMMNRCLSEDLPPGELDAVWTDIVQLVFSHAFAFAFAEETVLWPLLRRVSPDGEELTRQVEAEHQAVNDLVARIERSPDDPRRAEWIRRAFALVRQDIRDEEDELLPRLRTACDDRKLWRIGAAWEAVRATAPTRPHPGVPRRPPGNALRGGRPAQRLRPAAGPRAGQRPGRAPRLPGGSGCHRGRRGRPGGAVRPPARLRQRITRRRVPGGSPRTRRRAAG